MSEATDKSLPPNASDKQNDQLVAESAHRTECLSCRITGTAVMAGTGSYAIWQARAAAPGTRPQKGIVAGLGMALIIGSVYRWRSWQ